MDDTLLIAGLGNPGNKYEKTRHNAGFIVVDGLRQRWGGDWKAEARWHARIARARFGGAQVIFCQPQTYMNESGRAVAAVSGFYKLQVDRMLIVVDDADLPLGTVRMRRRGSSGGHHGLESIESHLGTTEFARQKIGIGRRTEGVRRITGHVLGMFSGTEQKTMDKVVQRACDQIECWIAGDIEKAMCEYNGVVDNAQPKETE